MDSSRKLSFFPPHASSSKPVRPVYKPFSLEEQQLFLQKQYPELLSEELRPTVSRSSLLGSSEPKPQANLAEEAPSSAITHGRTPSRGSHALFSDQSHLPGGKEWFSPSVPSWLTGKPLSSGFTPRRGDGLSPSPLPDSNSLTSFQGAKTSLFGPISPSSAAAAVFSAGICASEEVSQLLRESNCSTPPAAQQPSTHLSPKEKSVAPATDQNSATAEALQPSGGTARSPTAVSKTPEKLSVDPDTAGSTIDEVARVSPLPEASEAPAPAPEDELEPTPLSATPSQPHERAVVLHEQDATLMEEFTSLGAVATTSVVDPPVTHSVEVSTQPQASVQEEQLPQDHINIALEVAFVPLQGPPRTPTGPSPAPGPQPSNSTVQHLAQAIQTLEMPCTAETGVTDETAHSVNTTLCPVELVTTTPAEDSLHQPSALVEQTQHLPAVPDAVPRVHPVKASDLGMTDVEMAEAPDTPDVVAAPLPPESENSLSLPSEVPSARVDDIKPTECQLTDVEMEEALPMPAIGVEPCPLAELTPIQETVIHVVSLPEEPDEYPARSAEGEGHDRTEPRITGALASPHQVGNPTSVPQSVGVAVEAMVTPTTPPSSATELSLESDAEAVTTLAAVTPTAPLEASTETGPTVRAGDDGPCSHRADPPDAGDAMVIIEFSPFLDSGAAGGLSAEIPMSAAQEQRPTVAYASTGHPASPALTPATGRRVSKPTPDMVHEQEAAFSWPVDPIEPSDPPQGSGPAPAAAIAPPPDTIVAEMPTVVPTVVAETEPTVQQPVCDVPAVRYIASPSTSAPVAISSLPGRSAPPHITLGGIVGATVVPTAVIETEPNVQLRDAPAVPYATTPSSAPFAISSPTGCCEQPDVPPASTTTLVIEPTAAPQIQAPLSTTTAVMTPSPEVPPGEEHPASVPDTVVQGPHQLQEVPVQPTAASGVHLPAAPTPLKESLTPPKSQPAEPTSATPTSPSDSSSPLIDNSASTITADGKPSSGAQPVAESSVATAEELPQEVTCGPYATIASPARNPSHTGATALPEIDSEVTVSALCAAQDVAPTPAGNATPPASTGDPSAVHGSSETSDSLTPHQVEAKECPEPVEEPKERSITEELEDLLRGGDSLQEDFSDMELDCDLDMDEDSDAEAEAESEATESSKPSKPMPTLTAPLAALLPPQRLENIETFLEKVIPHTMNVFAFLVSFLLWL